MKKPVLVTFTNKPPSNKLVSFYASLPYHQTVIMHTGGQGGEDVVISTKSKVFLYPIASKNQIIRTIAKVIEAYPDRRVLPYFSGDSMSKYAISCYNQSFGTKVNARIFKDKSLMSDFFADYFPEKKSHKISGTQLFALSFEEITKFVGEVFVLKPTNAASSWNTFFVKGSDDWESILPHLKKKQEYVLETFVTGRLYALDGFFDGSNFFVLSYSKETPFCELFDRNYFQKDCKATTQLKQHFAFMLPIRYSVHENKLNPSEWEFIQQLRRKLASIEYRGFLHIEYKYDRETKQIGFIEWGARLGAFRKHFIKELRHTYVEKIPYEIVHMSDAGNFTPVKKGVYFPRDAQHDMNIIGINVALFEKQHLLNILKRSPKYLSRSLEDTIRLHLHKEGIEPEKIQFMITTDKDGFLYPFYQKAGTRLSYFMWLSDKNLKLITHKKKTLLERLVLLDFHHPRTNKPLDE